MDNEEKDPGIPIPHGMDQPYPGPEGGHGISSEGVEDRDELRLAKEYAEMIVDTVREALLVLDLDLHVHRANASFYDIFGVQEEETEGRMLYEIGDGQWNIPELRDLFERIVPESTTFNDYEVAHEFPKIGYRVMMLNARRLNDHQLILLAIEDITERRRAEQELQALNLELEKRIKRGTADLSLALRRLEQEYKDAQHFTFIASHDLQEPLRKIQTFSARFGQKEKEVLSEEGIQYLERMQHEASRMQKLIGALSDFSAVTTSGSQFVRIALKEVLKMAADDLQNGIAQAGGQLIIEDLPVIEADPFQMRHLFKNLIMNALIFRKPDEPVVIRIQTTSDVPSEDCERLHAEGHECIRIAVEDNGIGFDERYLSKIFSPFQRLHPRDTYHGIGMGLAICKKIVERHNGSITARSTPGAGSKFILTLPIVQERSD